MLQIGNNFLTYEEEKSHFALWAIAKAPLIIGCDLAKISDESLAILKNKALIQINQDPLGIQGRCKKNCKNSDRYAKRVQVYAAPLANGDMAVVVMNWNDVDSGEITFTFVEIGILDKVRAVQNLWMKDQPNEFAEKTFTVSKIPPHGNVALKFIKIQ